jgi:hypothetical protein
VEFLAAKFLCNGKGIHIITGEMQEMTNVARVAINVMLDFGEVRWLNHF